ncbi:MAG: SWIM zinc finger family protein [Prevotella sp.]|jgi:hypothetical protein|nr:SWIM zinc finger family protein [Prevotella sp.]
MKQEMLSLNNFEANINSAVLQRGRDYFNDGLVVELEEQGDNSWSTEVCGSDDYVVKITLDQQDGICDFSCDCLYDGPLCKHVVAVLYAIREKKATTGKTSKIKPSAQKKKNAFETLLDKVNLEEYRDFIRKSAAEDKNFKTKFELFFADKDDRIDVEKKYGDLIRKLIRKYSGCGFIDYSSTREFSTGIGRIIATGIDMTVKGNYGDAFLLCKVLLKELINVIGQCDDSAGYMGDVFSDAIELLDSIAVSNHAAPDLKHQIADFLYVELDDKAYWDYGDFGYDLFAVFQDLAIQLNLGDRLVAFIDNQCAKLTGKYDNYKKEYFHKQKIAFYRATGQDDRVAELIRQNMDIVDVRREEVNKAIDRQDYQTAKQLIAEGIRIATEKEHPGTVSAWQKDLLRIAFLENDVQTVRQLARHFAFDMGFSREYYREWKKTYSAEEWKETVEKYIADKTVELTREYGNRKGLWGDPVNRALLHELAPVYIEEQYWDRLLALVQTNADLNVLLSFHVHLSKRYPEEMLSLFVRELKMEGSKVSHRNEYAALAGNMLSLMKDMPAWTNEIKDTARKLIALNSKRPAMKEELNRVLK